MLNFRGQTVRKGMIENLKQGSQCTEGKRSHSNTLPTYSSSVIHSLAHFTTSWLIPILSTFQLNPN